MVGGAMVLFSIFIILLFISSWREYNFYQKCLRNWGNEEFITYTGTCTEVYYNYGPRKSLGVMNRYFAGQGWHLVLEDGRDYYVPTVLKRELPLCNDEALKALAGKEITVRCFPENDKYSLHLVVYLESGDTVYVTEAASQGYVRHGIIEMRVVMCLVLLLFGPLLPFGLGCIYLTASDARDKRKKERRKQENMQRLKEADLLHPKNQRRRGPKGKDKA